MTFNLSYFKTVREGYNSNAIIIGDDDTLKIEFTVDDLAIYNVTLNTNGGTVNDGNITTYTEFYGATLPTDVTRNGYTFEGWYDNADLSGEAVTAIASDATGEKAFWAKWTETATVTKAPEAKTLTYNEQAQALVTAGTATGGTMQYALGENATTAPEADGAETPDEQKKWKTTIPTGTEAGTYYVWYKVVGDENHKDSEPACVTVEISISGSSGGSNADAVQAVINKINALDPSASDYAAKAQEAVDAYDALSDYQKTDDRFKNQTVAAKLVAAQQAVADKKAVDEANALICNLPDNPKQAAEADAQAAYKAYMELSEAQKALLSDDAKKKAAVYGYYYEAQYAKAQKAKLTSVKAKKGKKAAAKWKAVSGVSGYQLYYKAKGTKAKKVTIKSAKTLKRTVKKLKAGKKYTFKVRTFTKIYDPAKDKNVRVYGKWSEAKKIRAKK